MSTMGNDFCSIPAGIIDDDIENRRFPVGGIVESVGDVGTVEHRITRAQLVHRIPEMETKKSRSDDERLFDPNVVRRKDA